MPQAISTNLLDGSATPQQNLLKPAQPTMTGPPLNTNLAVAAGPAPAFNVDTDSRDFGDINTLRSNIYNQVLDAASTMEPVTNKTHTLRLTNARYIDPDTFSLSAQKLAVLSGQSQGRRLKGQWELSDNATGQVLDKREQVIATVPFVTKHGTFIHNGSEYTLRNQQRLRSGVFTRRKENGEIEAHANILPGKGPSHRYFLDPEKGVFYLKLGQAKLPLMPLLQTMGATPAQLRDAWGPDLYAANYQKNDASALTKLKAKLLRKDDQGADESTSRQKLIDVFAKMELDPEVTQRTLGKPYKGIGLDTVLDITKKLLAVSRGEAEHDDRDSLPFQQFFGPEDLFSERIKRDHGMLRRQLLFKASMKGNLGSMPSSALKPQIDAALTTSGLGQALEEINPAEIYDKLFSISRLGEGGIPSADSIPDEARNVQPSHMGYMDPVRTPECYDEKTEVFVRRGWVCWPEVRDDDEFACLINGRLEFHKAVAIVRERYTGEMFGATSDMVDYLVTPNHRMWTCSSDYKCRHTAWRVELASDIHEKMRKLLCTHEPYVGTEQFEFIVPPVAVGGNNQNSVPAIDLNDWAELLGWFLSEGHSSPKTYTCGISQSQESNAVNCNDIETLLDALPFAWNYNLSMRCYVISGKQISLYFSKFGLCHEKYIPEEVFDWPVEARRRLLESLLKGDGRKNRAALRTQYCTTSQQLAVDVQRLLLTLGVSSCIAFEPDNREERYLGCWVVHAHLRTERVLTGPTRKNNHYYVKHYDGIVYCAQVPGSLLYVRRNERCGFWCGNSFKVGIDVYLTRNSRKGKDGKLYAQFNDPKTGQDVWKTPQELSSLAIAQSDAMTSDMPRVPVLRGGKYDYVPKAEVDLVLSHMENGFSPLGNMIPLKSLVKPQRMAMASRMLTQALPLKNPQAPWVQSGIPGAGGLRSYEGEYSKFMGAMQADKGGRVTSVSPDGIDVKYDDGTTATLETYNNYPFNRKTYIHQTPVVQPGDTFKPGQLLARSNFTDQGGITSLGRNFNVAYMTWQGKNFEDAAVISESAAGNLSSEHMYQHDLNVDERTKTGLRDYLGLFPGKYDKQTLAKMDERGIIKPGTIVEQGQPLILAARQQELAHNKVHKKGQASYGDASVVWDHHDQGIVTDVVHSKHGPVVLVKSTNPMQVGDKLSGRYGDKGVVAAIIPDEQMPHGADGKPFEILLNPLGIISRTNPAQTVELALGKLAAKRGKPFHVEDFEDKDYVEWAIDQLRQNNMELEEDVFDPTNDRKIKGIPTGSRFFMKLHHTAESKGQARSGGSYTIEGSPSKGGPSGSKRVALLDTNALLAHGATETLRDAGAIRGQRNENYWLQFMNGHTPAPPKVPMVYEKFINQLQAAGINVVRSGAKTNVMALTDKDVHTLAGDRVVANGETVNFDKGLKPVAGGLFDPAITGGHEGRRWSAIKLHEPMPNPVMEEPIRRMLNLTGKQFEGVMTGEHSIPKHGTGPQAIAKALKSIDVDRELELTRVKVQLGSKTERDQAIRRLGYLKSAKQMGLTPGDWVLQRAPVLPPAFRPISMMSNKMPLIADSNYLYKELIEANQNLSSMIKEVGSDGVGPERLAVYHAFKAVTGLGDPLSQKSREKGVKGVLASVFGNSPKYGTVQRKLLSTTVDNVGRAVITPNPDLDMDSVGLPEDKAFDIYSKFVARRLKRAGMPLSQALQEIKGRSERAKKMLIEEMADRPVYINRAPVLHKFGIMAFRPQLVKGETMQISPLVVKGFNADFDGDAMNFHVPTDEGARKEAFERLLPSRSLLSPSDFKSPVHSPSNEYIGGLYHATNSKSRRTVRTFRSLADARKAYANGDIAMDDQIQILEH